MPKRTTWSKTIEAHGVTVRLYERQPGGAIYRAIVVGRVVSANGKPRTQQNRRSLGHTDRALAEKQARALCREIAALELAGQTGPLTFGELRTLYLHHRAPLLTPARRAAMERTLELFARHLEPGGRPFPMGDFGQTHADAYAAARRSGALRPDDPHALAGVRDSTIRNELQALSTVCNWAASFRLNGRALLTNNPVRHVRLPAEKNPRRPVASADRYRRLRDVADRADASGQLRAQLALAYYTGRRINAICRLRASDLLLTREAVAHALALMGQDERLAEVWPRAIRWRAENDKTRTESVAPIGPELLEELERYLRRAPAVGEAWLFPYWRRPQEPTPQATAYHWLKKAEALAGLPHQDRGGFHAYRRGWATARKAFPVQDVMAAGGWRDFKALQKLYQQADPETVRRVVELSGE